MPGPLVYAGARSPLRSRQLTTRRGHEGKLIGRSRRWGRPLATCAWAPRGKLGGAHGSGILGELHPGAGMGGGQESPGSVTALGDSAAALASARPVTQAELPTAERQARFCIGTARGWQQHGRPDQAYQALLAAERHVPEEIRRGSVRMLITHDGTGTRRGLTASANLPRAQGASLIRREHEGGCRRLRLLLIRGWPRADTGLPGRTGVGVFPGPRHVPRR